MSRTFYKWLSVIIAIVGIIAGIVLGNVFGVQKNIYTLTDAEFNYAIMFTTWLSTFFLTSIFAGIFIILDNQQTIYSELFSIEEKLYKIENQTSKNETKTAN